MICGGIQGDNLHGDWIPLMLGKYSCLLLKEVHGIEEGNFQKNIVILQILGRFICNWKYDSKNFG